MFFFMEVILSFLRVFIQESLQLLILQLQSLAMSVEAPQMIPGIVGLGKAVGDRKITNDDIIGMIDLSDWQAKRDDRPNRKVRTAAEIMPTLLRPVGIESRNWVSERTTRVNSELAFEALLEAIAMSGFDKNDLKGITVGTMTQDNIGSPVASILQDKLGHPNEGHFRDVGAACVGFLHALNVVYTNLTSPLGAGSPQAAIGSEILSRAINPKDPNTFPLFADAAGAVVVANMPDRQNLLAHVAFDFGADGSLRDDLGVKAGGSLMPTTAETIEEGLNFIHMNGPIVAREAVRRMTESAERVLEKAGVTKGEILLVIPHQANLELIKAVVRNLEIPFDEKVFTNIEYTGNTSAASIPVAMSDAYHAGRLLPNEFVLMCSFGAGMTYGSAVIPLVGLPLKH